MNIMTLLIYSCSNMRTVRAFAREPHSQKGFNKFIDISFGVGKKSALALGIFQGV